MTRSTNLAFFSVGLIAALLGAACGGDEPNDPSPLPCSYTLSPTSHAIGSEGGTGVVTVTTRSDCAWTAASGAAWITIASAASVTGPGSVSYVVAANPAESPRTGTMTIADVTFTVVEEGRAPCTFDVSPQQQSFNANGGNGTVAVVAASDCSWTATTTTGWLTIVSGSQGEGNGSVSYSAAPNSATEVRSGTLTVAGVDVAIAQAAAEPQPPPQPAECQYSVAPIELRMHWHHTGSEVTLSTQSDCRWTVESDTAWLHLVSAPEGTGPGTIRFAMGIYTEESSRAAALRVRWPTPTAGQNVWITHEGCRYAVTVTSQNFTADGGRGTVDVFGGPISTGCAIGCPWTATSQASWIHIVTSMPSAGDNRFTYDVDPNPGSQERIGQILVEHRIITIRQAGR